MIRQLSEDGSHLKRITFACPCSSLLIKNFELDQIIYDTFTGLFNPTFEKGDQESLSVGFKVRRFFLGRGKGGGVPIAYYGTEPLHCFIPCYFPGILISSFIVT